MPLVSVVFSVPHTKEKLSNVKETIWLWKRMSEEQRWFQPSLQNMFHIVSDKPLLPPSSSSVCSWTICRLTPAASSVSPKRVSWSWALLIQPAAPPRPPCPPPPPSWPMACLHPSIRLRPHLTSCRNGSSPLPRWVELRDTLKHTCRVHGMHINLYVCVCVCRAVTQSWSAWLGLCLEVWASAWSAWTLKEPAVRASSLNTSSLEASRTGSAKALFATVRMSSRSWRSSSYDWNAV